MTLVRSNSFVRAGGSKISIAAKERRTQREDRSWTLTNRNLRCELGDFGQRQHRFRRHRVTPTNVAGIFLEAGVTSFNFDPTWPNTIYTQTAWVFSCSSFPALTLSDS